MLRLVTGAIGSVLEATGLTGLLDRSDRSAQNRPNCFKYYFYQSLSKPNLFLFPYILVVHLFGPRISSKMSGHSEKRSKLRHDPTDVHMADADAGGSGQPNVFSGRELRTRKRAAASNILEDSNGSSSSDDDVEDEPYRVEQRAGKGPA